MSAQTVRMLCTHFNVFPHTFIWNDGTYHVVTLSSTINRTVQTFRVRDEHGAQFWLTHNLTARTWTIEPVRKEAIQI